MLTLVVTATLSLTVGPQKAAVSRRAAMGGAAATLLAPGAASAASVSYDFGYRLERALDPEKRGPAEDAETSGASALMEMCNPAPPDTAPPPGIPAAAAAEAPPAAVIAAGTVRVQAGVEASDAPATALYVTVRVIPQNNVGRYVTAGKVPPLAAARFASPTFPYSFSISLDDITPEFSSIPRAEWERQDLIVSARLDTDGVAATRDPADLVGRGLLEKRNSADPPARAPVDVELQGRGLTGRLLTGGK